MSNINVSYNSAVHILLHNQLTCLHNSDAVHHGINLHVHTVAHMNILHVFQNIYSCLKFKPEARLKGSHNSTVCDIPFELLCFQSRYIV
jgi:hypothetical protein